MQPPTADTASRTAMSGLPRKRSRTSSEDDDASASKKLKAEINNPPSTDAGPSSAPVATNTTNVVAIPSTKNKDASGRVMSAPNGKKKIRRSNTVLKASKKGAPPIASLFDAWEPSIDIPAKNDAWGTTPMPGPGGPQCQPDLPPARTSNAATDPPMWEDRKWRFKVGSQLVDSFAPTVEELEGKHRKNRVKEHADDSNGTLLNQEDNLCLKLIDMRPKSRKNREPRREPVIYFYEHGKPKDWGSEQAIKALNDRRRDAIWRMTQDVPWTDLEREFLSELCSQFPDASITELAERFNHRFVGDLREKTGFSFMALHSGRTLESVRHEYLLHKQWYDNSQVPNPMRQEQDKTGRKKMSGKKDLSRPLTASEYALMKFGPRSGLEKDDYQVVGYEQYLKGRLGNVRAGTESSAGASETERAPEGRSKKNKASNKVVKNKAKVRRNLILENEDHDQELLELAGYYGEDASKRSPATSGQGSHHSTQSVAGDESVQATSPHGEQHEEVHRAVQTQGLRVVGQHVSSPNKQEDASPCAQAVRSTSPRPDPQENGDDDEML